MFAGGSSKEKVAPTSTPESRFSLPFLKKLHQELLESKNVDDNNESQVIEILRLLAEMVVYGDNKSEMLFDFFCEKNMLSLFLEIMWCPGGCPLAVHFQILQTLSILVNSVKNDTSLYYLLSNNYVNEIIVFPHDFSEDESLRDQFVSFMKSLSLRLNRQTVQFFFIEETGSFPLLMKAIELIVYNEPMVRIASQTTILNVFRVNDERARGYALQDDILGKFITSATQILERQFDVIFSQCQQQSSFMATLNPQSPSDVNSVRKFMNNVSDALLSFEDWCYYLQDLLNLGIPKMARALSLNLLVGFVYKVLLKQLVDVDNWSKSENYKMSNNAPISNPSPKKEIKKLPSTNSNSGGANSSSSSSSSNNTSNSNNVASKQSKINEGIDVFQELGLIDEDAVSPYSNLLNFQEFEDAIQKSNAQMEKTKEEAVKKVKVLIDRISNKRAHGIIPKLTGDKAGDSNSSFGSLDRLGTDWSDSTEDSFKKISKDAKPWLDNHSSRLLVREESVSSPSYKSLLATNSKIVFGEGELELLREESNNNYSNNYSNNNSKSKNVDAFNDNANNNSSNRDALDINGHSSNSNSANSGISTGGNDDNDNNNDKNDDSNKDNQAINSSATVNMKSSSSSSSATAAGGGDATCSSDDHVSPDDSLLSAMISMILISQLFKTISNQSFRRSVLTALFHPLNRSGRRLWLTFIMNSLGSSTDAGDLDGIDSLRITPTSLNPYREAICKIFASKQDRLSIMAANMIHNMCELTISDINKENNGPGHRFYVAQMELLSLYSLNATAAQGGLISTVNEIINPLIPDKVDPDFELGYFSEGDKTSSEAADFTDFDIDGFHRIFNAKPAPSASRAGKGTSGTGALSSIIASSTLSRESAIDFSADGKSAVDVDIMSIHKLVALNSLYSLVLSSPEGSVTSSVVNKHLCGIRGKVLSIDLFKDASAASTAVVSRSSSAASASATLTSQSTILKVISDPQLFPLVAMQYAAHTLYAQMRLNILASNVPSATTVDINATTTVATISNQEAGVEKVALQTAVAADEVVVSLSNPKSESDGTNADVSADVDTSKSSEVPAKSSQVAKLSVCVHKGLLIEVNSLHHSEELLLGIIRESGRRVASSLKFVIDDPNMAEGLLNLLQEELRRISGRKWSQAYGKVFSDPLLLLPANQHLSVKYGLEYSVPISKMEIIRRDLQIFILLRSLYKNIQRLVNLKKASASGASATPQASNINGSSSSNINSSSGEGGENSSGSAAASVNDAVDEKKSLGTLDDICNELIDNTWQQYLDKTLISSENFVGQYYNMKSKKYLDCYEVGKEPILSPYSSPIPPVTSSSNSSSMTTSPNPSSTSSSGSSSLLSTLSFGLMGSGSKKGSSTNNSPVNKSATSSPTPTPPLVTSPNPNKSRCGEILFVQDKYVLLIVKPEEKLSSETKEFKVKFKILVAAPLMYTDVTVDSKDKTKLRVLVRSWDNVMNMNRLGSDLENIDNSGIAGLFAANKDTSLLLPRVQGSLWEMNLGFELDKACSLSAHHIDIKRQQIRQEKIKYLSTLFAAWAQPDDTSSVGGGV